MARSKAQIRKTYSRMLGEDLVAKLSDDQIVILSKYYNSLDAEETSDLDSKLIQGRNDTDLHEMARDMVGEEEEEEDIPEGLDDLLGSIQEESPIEPKVTTIKAGAIVPAKFFGEDKYAKYRDELIAEGTIEGEQLTSEERKEGFKTRNDSDKFARFVENFLNRKKESDKEESRSLGASGAIVVPTQQKINIDPLEEEKDNNFDDILKGIDDILEVIKKDQDFDKKKANKERKKEEREKRSVRENKLEKKDSVLMKAAKSIVAPVKSIFDKILEYFATVFLGRALFKLLDWFGDPDNKKKIDNIIRFLGDFWPALLGGYLLFGTKLGGLITSITGMLVKFTPKILKLLKNPIVAGAGLFMAGAAIPALFPQTVEDEADKQANKAAEEKGKEKAAADIRAQNENRGVLGSVSDFFTGAGQEREEQAQRIETGQEKRYGFFGEIKEPPKEMNGGGVVSKETLVPQKMYGGGKVSKVYKETLAPQKMYGGGIVTKETLVPQKMYGGGEVSKVSNTTKETLVTQEMNGGGKVRGESGIDKVPAMLTNGEFVMSTGAVQKYGLDTMMAMNAAGGGTNKPKIMQGTVYAQGGGLMGDVNTTTTITDSPSGTIDFDPVSYRQGMISSKHIENPGNTGETYVLGYTRSPEGDVMVKQMNRVVNKAGILSLMGASDQLTGVSPDSDKWNIVLNSANTQKELSTFSSSGRSRKRVAPKSIKTDPKAKIAYAYNQSYQTIKNSWEKKGVSPEKAKQYAAAGAAQGAKLAEDGAYLPTSEKGYKELENVSVQKNTVVEKSNSIVEMLKNAIISMSGVSPDSDKTDRKTDKKENTNEYNDTKMKGAKLGEGYGSEGEKIAGDLGTFMKTQRTFLPVTGSIHRHPKHPSWSKSGHSANSYHYDGRALDIGGWAPSHPSSGGNDEQAPVLRALIDWNKKNKVEPVELIHGSPTYKNYGSYRQHPDSHANHVHVAYKDGGPVITKPAKLTVPEITPLQKSQPKVTVIDGGTKTTGSQRASLSNKIPDFNASSASRAKANLLGIIDY